MNGSESYVLLAFAFYNIVLCVRDRILRERVYILTHGCNPEKL